MNGDPQEEETEILQSKTMPTRSQSVFAVFAAFLGWGLDAYGAKIIFNYFARYDILLFSYAAPLCVPYLLGYTSVTSEEAKQQTAFWSGILATILLIGTSLKL